MEAKRFLILILSVPYLLLTFVVTKIRVKSIVNDYKKCIDYININSKNEIASSLISILIVAEDHRHLLHMGIDPIAIIRAIYLKTFKNTHQGASTIDQQLVRTITKRYEKTIRRKLREQILAILIRRVSTPNDICKCYISCCYYGYNTYGIDKLLAKEENICEYGIIARIKYPFRKNFDLRTEMKYHQRIFYLRHLHHKKGKKISVFLRNNSKHKL